MLMKNNKVILIAGPTASGKSALALDLALKTRGTIINADSMQIYAGLPILSSQPHREEIERVPHELYGILAPTERSSVARWLTLATAAINKTIAMERTPIVVGGTGLYFKALRGGLAAIPAIPPSLRAAAQTLYDEVGEEQFRLMLAKHDPEGAARLTKNDRQRLIRSYEVAVHTGKSLSQWQASARNFKGDNVMNDNDHPTNTISHLLMPAREDLYMACNQRFVRMIKCGAVEEVKTMVANNLNPELPIMKTLGFREIAFYLNGDISLEEAIAKAQQATRNYAKRQLTWFRNQWTPN
jgi:tRNA dimethylallyltransferase